MKQRIAFVRHGEKDKTLDGQPMTARGAAQVHLTATWLAEQGFQGALVIPTETLRTQQTSAILVEALGASLGEPRDGLPVRPEKFTALIASHEAPLVVFVGHRVTHQLINRDFDGARFPVPAKINGGVFILEHDGTTWRCVTAYAPLA